VKLAAGAEGEEEAVDWRAECLRLRQREKMHLRQIKMLQTMLSAAAGLDSEEGLVERRNSTFAELQELQYSGTQRH
jgi:hypothetical protein